ncbi:MAG: hypothetical protein AAF443_09090 [Chlamydiota bacterium]
MANIEGPSDSAPISPEEIEQYKRDYQESLQLFQNAFHEYNKPNLEPHKKAKFKQVMDEALNVMNQTACVALKKGKQANEVQLEKSYQAFIENPTPANRAQLIHDIKALAQ